MERAGDRYPGWVQHMFNLKFTVMIIKNYGTLELRGCKNENGNVNSLLENESEIEYYSIYQFDPNDGWQCQMDIYNKDLALYVLKCLAGDIKLKIELIQNEWQYFLQAKTPNTITSSKNALSTRILKAMAIFD